MRSAVKWSATLSNGQEIDEIALAFDQARDVRVLVLPALFEEANKLRRTTVEIMHRLDLAGFDTILPDLPGCNESLAPLADQSLDIWREAALIAAQKFKATHCFAIRAGALIAPANLPGWLYAPCAGRSQLRSMLRAKGIAAKEAGLPHDSAALDQQAKQSGITLAGWELGAQLYRQLCEAKPDLDGAHIEIKQNMIGGPGIWLRAEPDEDPQQTDAIASIIAIGLNEQNHATSAE